MEENTSQNTNSVKKVVIIGPESTGKSTLASLLAKYYDTTWVKEYAREYIDRLDRPYEERDLLDIAHGQLIEEDKALKLANNILICDTNLITIKVWAEHKFGACYDEILDLIKTREYDLYLLTNIDVPWSEDPQREHPNLRSFFFDIYKQELTKTNVPWEEIVGENHFDRQRIAVNAIDRMLKQWDEIQGLTKF